MVRRSSSERSRDTPQDELAPYPARQAFVVQIHRDGWRETESSRGRVEHVQTGRSAEFDSEDELFGFIRLIAREGDTA